MAAEMEHSLSNALTHKKYNKFNKLINMIFMVKKSFKIISFPSNKDTVMNSKDKSTL